ncbi:hypothetical protein L7F22_041985 [Adiantum nelumboides]|nr:hypothetical protein [Adiantum nelumboides]
MEDGSVAAHSPRAPAVETLDVLFGKGKKEDALLVVGVKPPKNEVLAAAATCELAYRSRGADLRFKVGICEEDVGLVVQELLRWQCKKFWWLITSAGLRCIQGWLDGHSVVASRRYGFNCHWLELVFCWSLIWAVFLDSVSMFILRGWLPC